MVISDQELLPEDVNWRDEGCGLFPSCLNCPLPRCIEEEPRAKQRLSLSARARRMAELRRDGKSTTDIARFLGVSKRTVQRTLNGNNNPGRYTQ